MSRRLATLGAVLLAGVLTTSACAAGGTTDPGGDVDPDTARTALEGQRTEVRDLAAGLATGAARRLDGRVGSATGRYVGCTSVFPEGHRDFRYTVTARIEAGESAATPLLDALAGLLRDAGLDPTRGERPGGRTLRGGGAGLEVGFSELPDQGRYVLLDVAGPCVEVPADQRDLWEGRTDEVPILG